MSNAERIIRTLDGHLDHPVRLVLYRRAAIGLGFKDAPDLVKLTLDVDAIIPVADLEGFRADGSFWDAVEATNSDLKKEGLYITHLFAATDVFVRSGWENELVPIALAGLRWLQLFRLATMDLVLTKMMRGNDAQDLADVEFLIRDGRITPAQLAAAFATVQIPDLVELRDAFKRAQPLVMKIAEANGK